MDGVGYRSPVGDHRRPISGTRTQTDTFHLEFI